jgi:hypothetical protein
MDTTVKGIGAVVIKELRAARYTESTIRHYQKTIEDLTEFTEVRGGVYTLLLGAEFASNTTSPRTGRFSAQRRFNHSRLVAVFNSYVQTAEVDLSVRRRGGGGRQPSTSEFAALIAEWEAEMDERGLALATRDAYSRVARGYLVFLEDRGVIALDGADAASVLARVSGLSAERALHDRRMFVQKLEGPAQLHTRVLALTVARVYYLKYEFDHLQKAERTYLLLPGRIGPGGR